MSVNAQRLAHLASVAASQDDSTLAAATTVRRQIAQTELLHDIDHETRQVPLRQPVLQRQRQEPRDLTIRPTKIPRYQQTSSTILSTGNTMY